MDKIQIVNWLLTRKCNLRCSYCRIVDDYGDKPNEYPTIRHYHQNEMSTDFVIDALGRLELHNPGVFHIFYGGEPALRKDLPEIINYCNKQRINYTIITNNSDEVQPMLKNLLDKTEYISGLTSSVDPLDVSDETDADRIKKSSQAIKRLTQYKGIIKDLVAEVTIDSRNVPYIYNLVRRLTELEINSSITFVDQAKNPYYDFSNITDNGLLVYQNVELKAQLDRIIEDNLDVHMAKMLFPKLWDILPAELDCGIEKDVHNLTIDSDGTVRLCLRIRGVATPKFKVTDYISIDGDLNPDLKRSFSRDKANYCEGCNHTCLIMSSIISQDKNLTDDLVHTEKRM